MLKSLSLAATLAASLATAEASNVLDRLKKATDSVRQTQEAVQDSLGGVTDAVSGLGEALEQGTTSGIADVLDQGSGVKETRPDPGLAVPPPPATPAPAAGTDSAKMEELQNLIGQIQARDRQFQEGMQQVLQEQTSSRGSDQYQLLMQRLYEVQMDETAAMAALIPRSAEFGSGIDGLLAMKREENRISADVHARKMALVNSARSGRLR